MAEEAPKAQEEEVVVVTDKTTTVPADKDPQPEPVVVDDEEEEKKKPVEETVTLASHFSKSNNDDKVPESGTFKEESTKLSDLPENENKALQELKQLIQEALNKHEFSAPANPPKDEKKEKEDEKKETVAEEKEKEEEKKETVAEEKEKEEEEKKETVKEENVSEVAGKTEEEVAGEEEKKEEVKEETTVVVEVDEEKVAAQSVDDDGAKTVEAIEETVVAVSSSSSVPKAEHPPTESVSAETEESKEKPKDEASPPLPPEQVSIWGIPLLADERSDVILQKFLRARDFKVKEAFAMIKNTIRWRKEFGIDELMEETFDEELEKFVYMYGFDKEGHPVCYNIYGEFQNKELYKKAFSDEEKRQRFLKWRIIFLEKSIRKLDFNPGGISTIVQVNDLKNSPGPAKWELRQATKQALQLLQDNYPEFVAKQIFINVPWWYLAVNRMISPFLTQRTKSKFVFAGPSKTAETLLRYIAPEQVPVKYGGLSKDGEFGNSDAVTEITVKPATKHTVEFPVTEKCLVSWELRVIGWEVSYEAEFVPSEEAAYTVLVQKTRKVGISEEPVLFNSYKVGEPGKLVLIIDNPSSKKKKLLYRLKTKPTPSD